MSVLISNMSNITGEGELYFDLDSYCIVIKLKENEQALVELNKI
jgi:hypothetical protein